MTLTVESLNTLENKLASSGQGIAIFDSSTVTYNMLMNAVNNNLLPILKDTYDGAISFYRCTQLYYNNSTYTAFFNELGARTAESADSVLAVHLSPK